MPWIYRRYGDVVGAADIASPVRSSKNLKRLGADLSLGQHFIGWTLTAALVAVLVLGAASRRTAALMPGEALAQGRKQTHSDAVGVWEGTTLAVCPGSPANRCNAQQKVTMTLVEGENSSVGATTIST
jgi:hypothetical protein